MGMNGQYSHIRAARVLTATATYQGCALFVFQLVVLAYNIDSKNPHPYAQPSSTIQYFLEQCDHKRVIFGWRIIIFLL